MVTFPAKWSELNTVNAMYNGLSYYDTDRAVRSTAIFNARHLTI